MKKIAFLLTLFISSIYFAQTIGISLDNTGWKKAFKNSMNGQLVTGFIYNRIESINSEYFSCSLADTSFKGNCTLLDASLKEVIPYGLFSEIILSEDENFATVASDEYQISVTEYEYDTITSFKKTKDWGVYDIKNKKLILPLKYNYLSKVYKDGSIVFNSGGYGFMHRNNSKGGTYGVINLKGEIICKAKYAFIGPFNDKDIALAEVDVYSGKYIAINKKGENIKPNFYIDPFPIVKKIVLGKSKSFIKSDGLNDLMNFKNDDDSLKRDSMLYAKYSVDFYRNDSINYEENEWAEVEIICNVYEKNSKVEISEPLPLNYKYYYKPIGSGISNWGKHDKYKNNRIPLYSIFENNEKFNVASFFSVDSIIVNESDSLELDYTYPGIYAQNKKVLGHGYCEDIRLRRREYERLDHLGFIFKKEPLDTVIYKYKFPCDTVENTVVFCKKCDEGPLAKKYFYKKSMGLLLNEEVVLPPVYSYIISLNKFEYQLLDSLNNLWDYNLKTNILTKSSLLFEKIINKYIAKEDDPYSIPYFFVTKTREHNYKVHYLDGSRRDIFTDSLKVANQIEVFEASGEPMIVTMYRDISNEFSSNEDLVLFRKDSVFDYNTHENTIIFTNKISNFFHNAVAEKKIELNRKGITLKKVNYKNFYYKNGFYLLETGAKTYIFSNGVVTTSNSIKVDSVSQLGPNSVYWYKNKMFLVSFDNKSKMVQNKKVTSYFLTKIDSAKQLELLNKFDKHPDLYKSDGIYKSSITKKAIIYIPANFKEVPSEKVFVFAEDKNRGYIKNKTFYIISRNNIKYLYQWKEDVFETDSITNGVTLLIDEHFEIKDSAKSFDINSETDDFVNSNYSFRGTYKADGVLKSLNSFKKLPVQSTDSVTVIATNEINIETFTFCKNKQWKILCINLLNPEEFIILENHAFKSFQDIRKTFYPYEMNRIVNCPGKSEKQIFEEKTAELAKKSIDNVPW